MSVITLGLVVLPHLMPSSLDLLDAPKAPMGEAKRLEAPAAELRPSPELTPAQVVEIQLRALASNQAWGEDRGIALTYRFASPENRRATGPLPRFSAMVKGGYGALVDAIDHRLGPPQFEGAQVVIPVVVTAKDGSNHGYVWVLGRQKAGDDRDCWMTNAVVPAGVEI